MSNKKSSTNSPLPDNLLLGNEEIAQRKAFLEFADKDVTLLTDLHALLEDQSSFFVDDFYRHLLAFDETRQLIQDDATLTRLKQSQAMYFNQLTAGNYDKAYVQNRIRVGAAHQRVGLDPKWYLGAYNKYLSLLLPKVWGTQEVRDNKHLQTTLALLKIIFLDMGIAIDTYIHADQEALRHKNEHLDALNQMAITITSSLGLKEVTDRIMHSGISLASAMAACIAFYNEESGKFENYLSVGLSEHFVKNMTFRPGGIAEEAFTSGSCIVSNDNADTLHKLSALTRNEGILGFICLPLVSQSHRLGVLYLYLNDHDKFSGEELGLLTTFSHLAAGALDNARLHARTLNMATTDTLTGLYNRRLFDERLNVEMQRSQRFKLNYSLLILDIDHFKKINDTYGHLSGDAVLKQLADVLREHSRDVDTVARYGGEEFVIVTPESDGNSAKVVGERIRKAIASTAFILPDGREIDMTVSIGIACYPGCADDIQNLIDRADKALYLAKQEGRNRVYLYSEMLNAELEKSPDRIAELLNQHIKNARSVGMAVNIKTAYLRDHADQVEKLAMKLGKWLKLPTSDMKMLSLACILHDLGYINVPENILNKSEPFTDKDWEIIKQHPVTANNILLKVPALQNIIPLVRHHHEWVDGSGYPDRLKGDDIPYLARILAIIDAYSAMISDRPQRKALKLSKARAAILAGSGKQFDAHIAAEFIAMLKEDE